MPVLQLVGHVGQRIEQGDLRHRVGDQRAVALVHLIPIHLLITEETIVLVQYLPQRLEILAGRRLILVTFLATREKTSDQGHQIDHTSPHKPTTLD